MKKYKVLLFDLDDTLIDNLENVKFGFKEMIKQKSEKYKESNFLRWYQIDIQFWDDFSKRES